MDDLRSEFLNVDLDLKSTADLAPLVRAFGRQVVTLHVGRVGRKHWVTLQLLPQPKTPNEGIVGFGKLVTALPRRAREIWNGATKEFDLGFQCGLERTSAYWVLDPKVVEAAAKVGAQIRFTMYSPQLVIDAAAAAASKGGSGNGRRPDRRSRAATSTARSRAARG